MMRKAQSFLEYSLLLMIIIAAFLTMQAYIKRGFQGRMKQSADDLGDQYDANALTGQTHYALSTTSQSRLYVIPATASGVNGSITYRVDDSTSTEAKTVSSTMSPTGP